VTLIRYLIPPETRRRLYDLCGVLNSHAADPGLKGRRGHQLPAAARSGDARCRCQAVAPLCVTKPARAVQVMVPTLAAGERGTL